MKRKTTFLARASMMLLAVLLSLTGARAQNELTVHDGTDQTSIVPFYGYYADYGTRSQFIFPADELNEMKGGSINKLTFYAAIESTSFDQEVTVYLKEVDHATFETATLENWEDMTVVYVGNLVVSENKMVIEFSSPFPYTGDNLMVGLQVTAWGSACPNFKWNGENQTEGHYTAIYNNANSSHVWGSTSSRITFLPKTTFTFGAGGGVIVDKPETLEVSGITSSEAVLTWTGGTGTYNVEYKKSTEVDWTVALTGTNEKTCTLTGLTSGTAYQARVQSVSGSDVSSWKTVSFSTAIGFPYFQDFAAGLPADWTIYTGLVEEVLSGAATLTASTNKWKVGTDNGVLDGNHALANIYGSSTQHWLVTPVISVEADAQLAFDVAYTAYSGTAVAPAQSGEDDKFVVLISKDGMATWTILRQWDNAGSQFVLNDFDTTPSSATFDLSEYAGENVCVAFYVESTVSNADNNLHIDNVSIDLKPAVETPYGIKISYDGGTEATISWASIEDAWDIEVNGVVTEDVDNPFTLTGLEYATTYTIKVRAKKGTEVSSWSAPASFSTIISDDMCQIKLVLLDSWGDGWNGDAAIVIADVLSGIEIGSYSLTSGKEGTFVAEVPNNRDIQFTWKAGSYDSECSYTAYDINDEVIFSGSGAITNPVTWHVSCVVVPWKAPSDLAATEITAKSAKISWTENSLTPATAWVVAYKADTENEFTYVNVTENPYVLTGLAPETTYTVKVRPDTNEAEKWSEEITFTTLELYPQVSDLAATDVTFDGATITWTPTNDATSYELQYSALDATGFTGGSWYQYDDGTFDTESGSSTVNAGGSAFEYAVMFPAGSFTGNALSKVSIFNGVASSGTVTIYSGGDTAPGTQIASKPYTLTGVVAEPTVLFIDVDFGAVMINPNKNVWVVVSNPDGVSVAADADLLGDANGRWVGMGGTWEDLATYNLSYCWMVHAEIGTMDFSALPWTTVAGAVSPCSLAGLTPETDYFVRVKAIYGTEGESTWNMISFSTPESNPIASNVVVTPGATNATIEWEGTSESYEVKYRTAAKVGGASFFEDFENGLDSWTIYTDGEKPQAAGWYTYNPSGLNFTAHGGSYCASAWSWTNNTAYDANNWLVTPQVTFGKTLEFWVRTSAGYPDSYEVLLSTTDNAEASFTVELQAMAVAPAVSEWTQVSIDLSAYESQQGYIAIHHVSNDCNYLLIDDFGIYGEGVPAGDWATITTTETSAEITGLDPDTTYEFYIVGYRNGTANAGTAIASFTTTNATPDLTSLVAENITATSAEISWEADVSATGFTLQYAEGNVFSKELRYDDGTSVTNVGSSATSTWTWGVMYPGSMVTASQLAKVSIYETSYNTEDITINVYQGGDDAPGTLLYTETITPEGANAFHDITFATPVDLTLGENLWITLTEEGTYVLAACATTEPNNQWVESGSWYNIGVIAPSLADYGWMIRAEINDGIDPATVTWTTIADVTSPYELTGLNPETTYTVQVKATYGSYGDSEWATTTFTTLEQNPIPFDVAVTTTATTATVSWQGESESYEVKYRTPATREVFYLEDFENGMPTGPGGWLLADADGDGNYWAESTQFGNFNCHSGSVCMASASYYNNAALTPDNWLISPKLDLQGTLSVWLCGQDPTYAAEHFAIYLSTADEITDLSTDFNIVLVPETEATGDYVEYTADLSAYAGQQGYIAIRHFNCTDMFFLNVDDFGIYGEETPAGDWASVTTTETTAEITGLDPETTYEFTVIGIYGGTANAGTPIATFTTLSENPVPTNIVADLVADGATLTWDGKGDSYNVRYRTAGDDGATFTDDFESGLGNWTIYTEGQAIEGYNGWVLMNSSSTGTDYVAVAFSWYSGTIYAADNWLITPAVELGSTLTFDVTVDDGYPDSYAVLLSTSGNAIADFTTELQPMAEGASGTVTIDLSAYAGQTGYIAIHHVSTDCNYITINNFGIYNDPVPAGEWQEMAVTDAEATISGLATNKLYEYEIQSVKGSNTTEWSATQDFALLTMDSNENNNSLISKFNGKFAHVTLSNRTLYQDNTWNTIYLPFDMSLAEVDASPLAGGDVRTLTDNITVEGESVTLNFTAEGEALTTWGGDMFYGGVPYIVKWTSGNNIVNPEFANVTISSSEYYVGDENTVKFLGTYAPMSFTAENTSILFIGANNQINYPLAGAKIGAMRGYFQLVGMTAGNGVKIYTNLDDEDPTGIANIENRANSGNWFDISGRKLAGKPKMKGIYVNDGRKVTVK